MTSSLVSCHSCRPRASTSSGIMDCWPIRTLPSSPFRAAVVPQPPARDDKTQLELHATGNATTSAQPLRTRAQRIGWARLVRRVFDVDPLECPRCQRTMRLVSVVMEPGAIRAILAAIHRADSAAKLNPRLHSAALDTRNETLFVLITTMGTAASRRPASVPPPVSPTVEWDR